MIRKRHHHPGLRNSKQFLRGSFQAHACSPGSFRTGFSLLEVLVACGILVLGLTSIAALLPAAGARLSDATSEDRGGICSANAYSEIVNRGLAASDLFTSGTKACAFGQFPGALVTTASNHVAAATTKLDARIDGVRGFILEDDLVYGAPTTADTPVNSFLNGGVGPREYKSGICWGAMLTPKNPSSPLPAGSVATLSIAVFKKPGGGVQSLTLTPTSGLYTILPTDETTRKTYAKSCSYLLLLPSGTTPQWQRVNASWTASGTSYLTFMGTSLPTGTLTAIGFENLLRLDERSIVLE